MTVPEGSRIHPASNQLLDLADAMRPGEGWRNPIVGFLQEARRLEWTWAKACNHVTRLLGEEASAPRDLAELTRDPLEPGKRGSGYAEGLAELRALAATATKPAPEPDQREEGNPAA